MKHKLPNKISQTLAFLSFFPLTLSVITSPVEAKTETIIAQSRNTITCESEKGRRQRCLFDAPNGVDLIDTLSSGSCDGKWSYDDRRQYIEVWDGCRATFEERYYSNNNNNNNNNNSSSGTIICGSTDGKTNRCNYDGGDRVELIKVLSNASCKGNWSYNRSRQYVEVRNGCRGEFKGRSYSGSNNNNNNFGGSGSSSNNQKVVCESEPRDTKRCSINTRDGVRLTNQLSDTSCRGNWFSGNGFVEVKNGCRAVFESNSNNSSNRSEYDRGYDDARNGNSYRNLNNTEDYDRGYQEGRR